MSAEWVKLTDRGDPLVERFLSGDDRTSGILYLPDEPAVADAVEDVEDDPFFKALVEALQTPIDPEWEAWRQEHYPNAGCLFMVPVPSPQDEPIPADLPVPDEPNYYLGDTA